MKRGELSINTIIVLIIAVIVLVVIVIAFRQQILQVFNSFSNIIIGTEEASKDLGNLGIGK